MFDVIGKVKIRVFEAFITDANRLNLHRKSADKKTNLLNSLVATGTKHELLRKTY